MCPPGRDDPESLVGTTIAGKYFVQQLLGRGGMGHVYKATPLGTERTVAVKLLAAASLGDPILVRRFEREAAAASRLRHPNSIEVVDFGVSADGAPYLAMEFVPGRTLAQVIASEAPLPPARAVHLLAQVLAALGEAHAGGVVHRDLKPANVMIDPLRDPAGFVKVLDFGIAIVGETSDGDRLTGRDVVYGTPAYMSPEQIRGEPLDARSDLYSAGVMLFEMLAGAPPFDAPTPMAIAARHLTDRAPRLSERRPGAGIPAPLEALVASALEKEPSLRPASAEEMRAGLLASLEALPDAVRTPPARALPRTEALPRPVAHRRRSPLARAAAAAGGTLAVAALVVAFGRNAGPGRTAPIPEAGAAPASPRAEPASPPAPPPALAPPPATVAVAIHPEAPAARPLRDPARMATRPAARPAPVERRPAALPAPAPIRMVRGELNSVPTPPADSGDGVLVLIATPWADMAVDGVPLGETPREVRLAAGAHAVRAVHPDLGVREDRVVVAAGERKLWSARYDP